MLMGVESKEIKKPLLARVYIMCMARHAGIRTRDAQFRKLSLYPAELRARGIDYFNMNADVSQAVARGDGSHICNDEKLAKAEDLLYNYT